MGAGACSMQATLEILRRDLVFAFSAPTPCPFMEFSSNVQSLSPSATIAVSTLAKKLRAQGRDIIDLSAGEPDFPTPSWISDAAMEGIRGGRTGYTPAPGLPGLRAAVANHLQEGTADGWELHADEVVVTAGAKQALFNACFTLFGPGDQVLIATPYWTSYPQIVGLARAEPVFVKGREDRGFRLTPDELEEAAGSRARGLIICSPSNPTGTVYSRSELDAVARWARDRNIWLISDEIYRKIVFGPASTEAPGLYSLSPESVGPHVLVDGVSKCFAMTGWRIGYSVTRLELASRMSALQSHSTSNAATPSQLAALEALSNRDRAHRAVGQMVAAFRRRRDLVVSRVQEHLPDLDYIEPQGAFYLFLRVDARFDGTTSDSSAWCSKVLQETGVALVPGAAFGDDRYVRLSYATSDELLEEAIQRLARLEG